jgi:hypothetical protein
MTSAAQREANRRNAKLSTGPRTRAGKIVASRNAMRHGLSIPIAFDPEMSPAVEGLARAILGDSDDRPLPYARVIAETQLEINRVREARHQIIATAHDTADEAPPVLENKVRIRRFLQEHLKESPLEGDPLVPSVLGILLRSITPQPKPLERVTHALAEATKKLASLER